MKLGALILVGVILNQSAFAACEYERDRRDRNQRLCRTYSDVSYGVAAGAGIAGSIAWGPWGGLAGALGIIPGLAAKRVCDLAGEKEDQLAACEGNEVAKQKLAEEAANEQLAEAKAEAASKVIGAIWADKTAHFQQIAQKEIDALIDSYLDSSRDLSDPKVAASLDAEVQAIQHKYF